MLRLCIVLLTLLALGGTAHAESLDPEENTLWTLINEYRQESGLPPLGLNDELMAAAEWMSDDMATKDYFSHTDSLGRTPKQRMVANGYVQNTRTGENLISGVETAQIALDMWKRSPGHDAIMLGPFWAIGIARAYDEDSAYGWYWTVDFGGRGPAWFPPTPSPVLAPTPTPSPVPTPVPTPTLTLASVPVKLPSMGTRP